MLTMRATYMQIIAKRNNGRTLPNNSFIGNPTTNAEIKHPTGIVTMPQSIPKSNGSCFSLGTTPIASGILKEIVTPIIADTISPL